MAEQIFNEIDIVLNFCVPIRDDEMKGVLIKLRERIEVIIKYNE